jgi:hypothetical protein
MNNIDALLIMLNQAWEEKDYNSVLCVCRFIERMAKAPRSPDGQGLTDLWGKGKS